MAAEEESSESHAYSLRRTILKKAVSLAISTMLKIVAFLLVHTKVFRYVCLVL